MEGSDGEGILSGRQSRKVGRVSLLCIWEFLGGRGFVEGGGGEGVFLGHQFTREGGVSLPCTRMFLGGGEMWVGRGMSLSLVLSYSYLAMVV